MNGCRARDVSGVARGREVMWRGLGVAGGPLAQGEEVGERRERGEDVREKDAEGAR